MSVRHLLAGAAAALLLAPASQARPWVVSMGARVNAGPPYEGADHDILLPSPTFSVRPAERPYRFVPPDGGTTFALIDTDHVVLGPMARFRYKRASAGDLRGLRPIKWAAEPGAFLDLWPVKWLRVRGELRHGFGGHKGFVADAGADLVHTGGRWDASIGPRVGWGDDAYLNEYFGVTPEEAARSPLVNRPYNPSAGRRYTGVELAGAYHLDPRWIVRFDAGWRRLSDKAAHSPIVQAGGDADQVMGSLGVSYSFGLRL
jgi:outer membrane scaffolding protein for murein synthesis (MipA/OmpV family)